MTEQLAGGPAEACAELRELWMDLCSADRSGFTAGDVMVVFAWHRDRHGCDLEDVRAYTLGALLWSVDDPELIELLADQVEQLGDKRAAWRMFFVRVFETMIELAPDRSSCDVAVARRELARLCGRWDLGVED